ncbi:MAG: hypothetical protein DWH91_10925 [Planctomycetota bacterium]|nr:MAG: hypothetical protein DWH91_10925 [Planctomycetota bacterium]
MDGTLIRFCFVLTALTAMTSSGVAQGQATIRTETAVGVDGFPLRFSYYPAIAEKTEEKNVGGLANAGVVILLHGTDGARIAWDKGSAIPNGGTFPATLQGAGYAVVTVDLRKHGESLQNGRQDPLQPNDYLAMVSDLKVIKDFLQKEHQEKKLNMAKMAIVGVGISAPVAVAFAEADWQQTPYDDSPIPAMKTPRGQDIKAVALISPDATAGRLNTQRSVGYLNKQNLAFLFMAGKLDKEGHTLARKCFTISGGGTKKGENRVYVIEPEMKERGTDLFAKNPRFIEAPLFAFLETHVKKLTIPWADRRSRLDR